MKEFVHNLRVLKLWFMLDFVLIAASVFGVTKAWSKADYGIVVVMICFACLGIMSIVMLVLQIWEFTFDERD